MRTAEELEKRLAYEKEFSLRCIEAMGRLQRDTEEALKNCPHTFKNLDAEGTRYWNLVEYLWELHRDANLGKKTHSECFLDTYGKLRSLVMCDCGHETGEHNYIRDCDHEEWLKNCRKCDCKVWHKTEYPRAE